MDAPEVIVAASREEAVEAFGDGAGVTVVAGGTIVMPEITHGRLRPGRALLIGRAGLGGIGREDGRTTIGAATTLADARGRARAARHVRAPRGRPRDPRPGDARRQPVRAARRRDARAATCRRALLALDAQVRSTGAGGERTEPVEDFLAGGPAGRLVLDVSFADPERRRRRASVRRPHAHAYTILRVCAGAASAASCASRSSGAGPVRRPQPRRREQRRPRSACSTTSRRTTTRWRLPGTAAACCPCSSPRARPTCKRPHELTVNGVEHDVPSPPLTSLLHVLREELGITSPKAGCQQGGCGACTVLVDGEPRRACLIAGRRRRGRDDHDRRRARRRPTSSRPSRRPSTITTPRSAGSAPRAC